MACDCKGPPFHREIPEDAFPALSFPGSSEVVRKVLWSDAHGLFLPVFWGEGVRACLAALMGQCAGLQKVRSRLMMRKRSAQCR